MKLAKTMAAVAASAAIIASGSLAHAEDAKQAGGAQPAPPKIVSVQPGDYLEKIARQHETTSLRLYYANTEISDPDMIYPNQQLRVPAADEQLTPRELPASKPAAVAAPTAAPPTQSVSAPAPAPAAKPRATAPNYASGSTVWDRLAACESGGNWAINTGNGYYGGLQFSLSSWRGVGGSGYPHEASREEQIARGQILQSRGGWNHWPACSAKLGLR